MSGQPPHSQETNKPSSRLRSAFLKVDQYQPVYGFESTLREKPVSRSCVDRCEFLGQLLRPEIPNLRILDVGCSMGYLSLWFAQRSASVTGIDARTENVEFCNVLAGELGLSANFEHRFFDLEYCRSLKKGQFDVVFLFSVLHHVITARGLSEVQQMMREVTEKVDQIFVELARKTEEVPFEWREKVPEEPLAIFDLCSNLEIEHVGNFPALGSITERPLFRVRQRNRYYAGVEHRNFQIHRSGITTGSTRNRKYIVTDDIFTKCFLFGDGVEGEAGSFKRYLSEIFCNLAVGRHPNFAPLISHRIEDRTGSIVMRRARGENLLSALQRGCRFDVQWVAENLVQILHTLNGVGLSWNDFRAHNIILGSDDFVAVDFETAGPIEMEDTLALFLWVIWQCHTGQPLDSKLFSAGDLRRLPRPPWQIGSYSTEVRPVVELALSCRNIQEFLSRSKRFVGSPAGLCLGPDRTLLEARRVVAALYRAVLNREPDRVGFESHTARARDLGGLNSLEPLLRAFLASEERSKIERGARLSVARKGQPMETAGRPVRHILSLGDHCYSSMFLKRHGLKKWSGPFDWIFSSPGMIRHCLEDDFSTFLDEKHFSYLGPDPQDKRERTDHLFYRGQFKINSIFNHHDLRSPASLAYFQRAVLRFRSLAQSGERAILLQCLRTTPESTSEFEATAACVSRYAPGAMLVTVLIGKPDDRNLLPVITLDEKIGDHRLYRLIPISRFEKLEFEDGIDEEAILRVLKQYPLNLSQTPPYVPGDLEQPRRADGAFPTIPTLEVRLAPVSS